MNELPEIINTDIINQKWDAFWSGHSNKVNNLTPKQVLVISSPFGAGSAEQTQLQKILQACQLTEDQVAIIQLQESETIAWHELRDIVQPRQVILFGINPAQLGIAIQFMPHQVSRFNDRSWMVTMSLQDLSQQPEIKGHLWKYGFQPVFIEKVYG